MQSKEWHVIYRNTLLKHELERRSQLLNRIINNMDPYIGNIKIQSTIDKLIQYLRILTNESPPLEVIYGWGVDAIIAEYGLKEGGFFAFSNSPDRIEKCMILIGIESGPIYILSSLVHEYYHYVQVQKLGPIYFKMPDVSREIICNQWAYQVFRKYAVYGDEALLYYMRNAKSYFNHHHVEEDNRTAF